MVPTKKVLVVEDDKGMQGLLCDAVKKCGFTTLKAQDGLKALELIKNNKDINLIVLDIKLPKVHGFQILGRLKKIKRIIPVIICTAYAELKKDMDVAFYPKVITMDKPVSIKKLKENIKRMLAT